MSKSISEKYIKLSQREHVLTRPDTYIGSVGIENKTLFVATIEDDIKNTKLIYKITNYSSGFIKIFDEILVNASDHSIKTGTVSYIKVKIDSNNISIENDGDGIPVIIHDKEKVYIPELIFGHLLTGENYDDTQDRYGSGRNGMGAKLTNIFSKYFCVETSDGKKSYKQEFKNNMDNIGKPIVKKSKSKYTKISYTPDFEKFSMKNIDDDTKSILLKRVFDIAAYNPTIKVYLNDILIPFRSFKDYMKLFSNNDGVMFYEQINDKWEIGVMSSPIDTFTHLSMVNATSTIIGGTHVNYISNIIVSSIKEQLERGIKGLNIKPTDIKNRLLLFINCKLPNPTFDTQTKENLTLRLNAQITKDINLSDTFLKKISKSDIFTDLVELSLMKEKLAAQKELNKTTTQRIRIDKLVDANNAGKLGRSNDCYLFITEGLSAKTSAISGFAVTGRDSFGCYPIKGKLTNTRGANLKVIKENEEIKDLVQILGLEFGKVYKDTSELRYGKIVMMTDADCIDGETLVKTLYGNKKIKDLTYYDKVLSHTGEYKSILNIIETKKDKYIEFMVKGEKLKVGLTHKIPVYRNGEIIIIESQNLRTSDFILIKK